jgi:AraC-like DNA-binding protein
LVREEGQLWIVDVRPDPNAFPELTESTFARMMCTSRKILGETQVFRTVFVTHPEPSYRSEYDRIFRVPVVFGSSRNALQIDEAIVSHLRLPTSPRYITGVLRAHADALLAKLEASRSIRGRVEALVIPLLHTGEPHMRVIAGALCVSRQTLLRRLRAEGVTFKQVVDEARHKLALSYLETNRVSVKETAALVGYSDPAAFSRAFKRWTGFNPSEHASRTPS